MVTVYQAYVVPIFTGILIFGTITWMIYFLFFLFPRWAGIGRYFTMRKIQKKYKKGFVYDDEIIKLCKTAITRGWKLKDIINLTKNSPHKDEVIYTFFMMTKIKKDWFNPKVYHENQQSGIKFLEEFVNKIR